MIHKSFVNFVYFLIIAVLTTFTMQNDASARMALTTESPYTTAAERRLIYMPYYEQIGGSCWAADAAMLLRAHIPRAIGRNLGEILHYIGVRDDDWGIGPMDFISIFSTYLQDASGGRTDWRGYASADGAIWRILREIDAGHPVILNMGAHVVLVVGYKDNGKTLILHDSKGVFPLTATEGGMYSVRPMEWISSQRPSIAVPMELIWLNNNPPSNRTLTTIGLPSTTESGGGTIGTLAFVGRYSNSPQTITYAKLRFRPSSSLGYQWIDGRNQNLNRIPIQARELRFVAPVWNAGHQPARRMVQVDIMTGKTVILRRSSAFYDLRPAVFDGSRANSPHNFEFITPMGDIRSVQYGLPDATLPISILAYLVDHEGRPVDGWMVKATLDLQPVITGIEPSSPKPGEIAIINGFGFGSAQPKNGRVLFGGKEAKEYLSWSENFIRVRVPDGVQIGECRVATRPEQPYHSLPFKFTIASGTEAKKELFQMTEYAGFEVKGPLMRKYNSVSGRKSHLNDSPAGFWPDTANPQYRTVWTGNIFTVNIKDDYKKLFGSPGEVITILKGEIGDGNTLKWFEYKRDSWSEKLGCRTVEKQNIRLYGTPLKPSKVNQITSGQLAGQISIEYKLPKGIKPWNINYIRSEQQIDLSRGACIGGPFTAEDQVVSMDKWTGSLLLMRQADSERKTKKP